MTLIDEPRMPVRLLDDEELVDALEEIVVLGAHRRFHDLDQVLGADRTSRSHQQAAAPTLVVSGDRHQLQHSVGQGRLETGVDQSFTRMRAHHVLGAGARHHALGLDADQLDVSRRRGSRHADERVELLGRFS